MNDQRTATLVRELEELEDEREIRSCELAERSSEGLRVRLMFDPVSEVHPLYVEVTEGTERRSWPVPVDRGMDAFEHPFAYTV